MNLTGQLYLPRTLLLLNCSGGISSHWLFPHSQNMRNSKHSAKSIDSSLASLTKGNTLHPSPYKTPRVLVSPHSSVTLLSTWVECTKTATNKVLRQYTKYRDGARGLITLPASPEDMCSVPSTHT